MHKPFWILATLAATAVTAATVSMNNTPDMARQRAEAVTRAPAAGAASPVVVEFFTSQGCSSCPPSDRLAARLAQEPGVLVIQRPVTYWDRLGWKDTLGDEANTALQRAYAVRMLAGRNGVYTPQAVVSGRTGLVGSGEEAPRRQLAAARSAQTLRMRLVAKGNGSIEAVVSGGGNARADVMLVGLDREETVEVSRGENGGRRLRYTNIWQGERTLGSLVKGEASFMIDAADRRIPGADSYAVMVRQGEAGPLLGGAMLPRG